MSGLSTTFRSHWAIGATVIAAAVALLAWQLLSIGEGDSRSVVVEGAQVGTFTKGVDRYIEATSDPATATDVAGALSADAAIASAVAGSNGEHFVAARLVRSNDAGRAGRLVWAVQFEQENYFHSCPAPDGTPPPGYCPSPVPSEMFRLDYVDARTGDWFGGLERGIADAEFEFSGRTYPRAGD